MLAFAGVKTEETARKFAAYYTAIEKGHPEDARRFLSEGMDPNWRFCMESMLSLAARKNKAGVVKALLDGGADPNVERGGPLIHAVGHHNAEAVRALIAAGANVNLRGPGDFPALTDACLSGRAGIVGLLVKAGADLNKRCEVRLKGTRGTTVATPLIIAVWEGHAEVVKLMLQAGANLTAKDSSGRTAMDWARASRKESAAQILSLLEHAGGLRGTAKKPLPLPPDFSSRGQEEDFRKIVSGLKKVIGKSPLPLQAADGNVVTGGYALPIPENKARAFVTENQRRLLQEGCFVFHTKGQSKAGEATVAILPTTNVLDVVAAMQTNGANCQIMTEDIIKRLRHLSSKQPFELTGIGFDFLEGGFSSPVRNARKLAKWFLGFCPDAGDVACFSKQLEDTGRFFLWWD